MAALPYRRCIHFMYDVHNGVVKIQRLNERALETFGRLHDAGLVWEDDADDADGRIVLSKAATEVIEALTRAGAFDQE
jgi:hypothetical protein